MPKQSHPDFLIKLILRARALETETDGRDRGYIMLVTSVLSIMMFSMLAAYLVLTDMNKTATSAFVDSNNTFMASEFGLNTRANIVKQRFENYSRPAGDAPKYADSSGTLQTLGTRPTNAQIIAAMQSCIYEVPSTDAAGTNRRGTGDMGCAGNSGWTNSRTTNTRTRNSTAPTAEENLYNHTSKWQDIQVRQKDDNGNNLKNSDGESRTNTSEYTAYSFVVDRTGGTQPPLQALRTGEPYAGLLAQTYLYTVYASAVDNNNQVNTSNTNTVLQMDFRSRIVPLFQFAAFYDGDLEMNSTTNMTLAGRVHSNANLYVQPTPQVAVSYTPCTNTTTPTTFFRAPVTTAGRVYNRVNASTVGRYCPPLFLRTGLTAAQIAAPTNPTDYYARNFFRTDITSLDTPLTSTEIANYQGQLQDSTSGGQRLDVPPAGFLRKRNYYQSSLLSTATLPTTTASMDSAQSAERKKRMEAVGEYWSKADMRLEMVPDRGGINTTPNDRIIPFNFTSIHTANTDACSTTPPARNADPADNYIDPDRANAANLKCRIFTKGQLQSLRQPVMALTLLNQSNGAAAVTSEINNYINNPAVPRNPATSGPLPAATNATEIERNNRILRAVQVALVSTPTPLSTNDMNRVFNTMPGSRDGGLGTFRDNFYDLLNKLKDNGTITGGQENLLRAASPNQIAFMGNSGFLPAPIQMVKSTTNPDNSNRSATTTIPAGNARSSGFYDGREQRWITMLQTNMMSLSVWNRDGIFVESDDEASLITPYDSTAAQRRIVMQSTLGTTSPHSTNNMAFRRQTTVNTTAVTCTTANTTDCGNAQNDSLRKLGLAAADGVETASTTEGGLVFHATVRDDLNGDGTVNTSDIEAETNKPILRKNPDGTDYRVNNNTVTQDYARKYRGVAVTDNTNNTFGFDGKSPFGFAFNGGNDLPSAMNLVTDHAIYIQGNFNNYGNTATGVAAVGVATVNNGQAQPSASRQPAAIMADTITVLSNECMARRDDVAATSPNFLGVPVDQIKCGIPNDNTTPASTFDAGYGWQFYNVVNPLSVNAAFLSYTDRSRGNLGLGRGGATDVAAGIAAVPQRYSGGINNYMRMVEGWRNLAFNYSGSFISLGSPIESSGAYNGGCGGTGFACWNSGTYYDVPTRNFNYEQNFNTVQGLPPLTPRAVYLQQQVFRRAY